MNIKYIVGRCKSKTDSIIVGKLHGAFDDKHTCCGKQIDENWYISKTTTQYTDLIKWVECKDCLKAQNTTPEHNCEDNAVPYESDGALGHGFECGVCGKFLQAG